MAKHGKKYRTSREKVDRSKQHNLGEAIELVKECSYAGFDETLEMAVRLGIDPKHADQMVRGTVVLPNGTGKTIRIAVFVEGEDAKIAEEAGADIVGSDDLVEKVKEGFTDFDVAIAHPAMMGKVGKLGRILGPRGLMPNPKTNTVTFEVKDAVNALKAGRIDFKVDKGGVIHSPIGKVSFEEENLLENALTLIDSLLRARPASAKGRYLKSITISTTMGVGIKVDPIKTVNLLK